MAHELLLLLDGRGTSGESKRAQRGHFPLLPLAPRQFVPSPSAVAQNGIIIPTNPGFPLRKFLFFICKARMSQILLSFILLSCFLLANSQHKPTTLKNLTIGALFPMESGSGGWPGGQACLPAVQMALEDVNLDLGLLPNYALRLHHFNSKCQPGLAARQLFELLYNPPTKLILLSGCSPVTTIIAEAAPVWNLLVLSYGASSPALSNRERFPTLFRTHPSANMQNPTRVHLFEKFKWKRITILQSVEEVFDSTAKDLEEQCHEKGIRVERHSFYGDPTDALKAIRRQDARIIVGLFYVTEARRVLCQAYHHGLYGRKYVWFMIGWYADTWFIPPEEEALNCTRNQMEKAAQYHFTTESIMLSRDTVPTISGMTGPQFQERLRRHITTDPQETGGWPEAPLAYDAVWALALMLNCTMGSLPANQNLQQFNYNNTKIASKMFACMKDIHFRGVSGQVMFSDLGDRIARTQIEQMQSAFCINILDLCADGKYVLLGYYDSNTQTLEWKKREKFVGTRGPPPDSTRIKQWPITVNFKLYLVVIILMVLALAFCVALYFFNRRFIFRRVIAQAQPQCNNMLILGSAVCLLSLILMGFPTASGSNGKPLLRLPSSPFWFTVFCHSRLLLLMLGFSLAYGSLFAKVWVAHKLGAAQKKRQLAAARINNNEDDSTSAAIQLNSNASIPGPSSQPAGTPWESVRNIMTAVLNRQSVVATAIRKISQHSTYGNYSSTSGNKPISRSSNLLNLPIHPARFYLIVGLLCLLDLVISLIWICFDPMHRQQIKFPLQEPTARMNFEDIMLLPVLEQCESQNQEAWTVVLLVYKGLLLLLGLFLTYDTRHQKIRYLCDLKQILLSVCNIGVLCLLCGPIVVFFLRTQPNPFFCFVSATVFVCTCVSMGLVFGPKLLFIYRNPEMTKEEQNYQFQESKASQAEQMRYQHLLKENAELKRQIDMRNVKIQECRRILEGHLLLINPQGKIRNEQKEKFSPEANPKLNNNNAATRIGAVDCMPSSSGILEFEPTTISTAMEPTVITFLEAQQEEISLVVDKEINGNAEGNIEEDFIPQEEHPTGGGADTGVCSDYDEENGDEPMLTAFSNESSAWEEDEEEEEEILL